MKVADFVLKDNQCLCTHLSRLTYWEHAVREEPTPSPARDKLLHKLVTPKFEFRILNFIKTHNKCASVVYDRLRCGEHSKYLL